MKIIFFGSSHFGLPALKGLLKAGYEISCVVTQPDKKQGRGMQVHCTLIKDFALKNKLEFHQPVDINSGSSRDWLKKFSPDLFVVVAYGQILSPMVLAIPKIMALNIHGSLLPAYRGAAPINWAIIKGEKITGVSIIKMNQRMDAGPVILKKQITIEAEDNALTLEDKLSGLGAQALLEAIESIKKNLAVAAAQEEGKATLAPKLKKPDGRINWQDKALDIHNLIRGCLGWPDAFTRYKGKLLKIFKSEIVDKDFRQPGEIVEISRKGIIVSCGKQALLITQLQPEGKRRMSSAEFIAGHKIKPGDILENI